MAINGWARVFFRHRGQTALHKPSKWNRPLYLLLSLPTCITKFLVARRQESIAMGRSISANVLAKIPRQRLRGTRDRRQDLGRQVRKMLIILTNKEIRQSLRCGMVELVTRIIQPGDLVDLWGRS